MRTPRLTTDEKQHIVAALDQCNGLDYDLVKEGCTEIEESEVKNRMAVRSSVMRKLEGKTYKAIIKGEEAGGAEPYDRDEIFTELDCDGMPPEEWATEMLLEDGEYLDDVEVVKQS